MIYWFRGGNHSKTDRQTECTSANWVDLLVWSGFVEMEKSQPTPCAADLIWMGYYPGKCGIAKNLSPASFLFFSAAVPLFPHLLWHHCVYSTSCP
jgi:hypothetical protein